MWLLTVAVVVAEVSRWDERSDGVLRADELEHWGRRYGPNRLLCAVPTVLPLHEDRVRRVVRSWGKRCDKLVFVVSEASVELEEEQVRFQSGGKAQFLRVETVRTDEESARNIWEKVHLMWVKIAELYADRFEWFAKVDDDTFLFADNLKHFTSFYNPRVTHFFGHTILFRWKQDNIVFNSGVTYVISKETLLRIAPVLKNMPKWTSGYRDVCADRDGAGEDTNFALCLASIGIRPDNTLDHEFRQRFLLFKLDAHRNQRRDDTTWYWKFKPKESKQEKDCCSEDLICIHGFKNKQLSDGEFEKLEKKYYGPGSTRKNDVPPKPSEFLFDADALDFETDSFRNRLPILPREIPRPMFKGYGQLYTKQDLINN